MKGVIFNLLEDFITEGWGEDTYEEILALCPTQTQKPFVGPETYPDADLRLILARALEKLGLTFPEALRAFGKYCLPKLAVKFSTFVQAHRHPKSFLKTADHIMQVEVKKVMRGAEPPRIAFVDPGPDRLVLRYTSERKLCAMMAGMIEGTAEHFKMPIRFSETQCMLKGAEACEFHLEFPEGTEAAA